jgi:hypothetical protein
MSTEACTTDIDERPPGIMRQLWVPMLVAGVICAGVFFSAMKWLRPEPEPKAKVVWHITWVELANFKQPQQATQKEQR